MTLREFAVPVVVPTDPKRNLTDLVVDNAEQAPDAVAFGRRVAPDKGASGEPRSAGAAASEPGSERVDSAWQNITCAGFLAEVTAVAKGLIAAGIQAGDRIGLLAGTRYEWTLADFAIWFAGGITIPIYETSSPDQVAWILADAAVTACFVDTPEKAAMVESARSAGQRLEHVWIIDEGALESLVRAGEAIADDEVDSRRRQLTGSSIATIIYTSGTTGRPKGCQLSHANFVDLACNTAHRLSEVVCAPGAATLLFLPLAHVFARFVQILCVAARARVGYAGSSKTLLNDLASFRPTFVLAVPRVFEKIYNSSEATAAAGGKGAIFRAAATTAIAYSKALDSGRPGLGLRIQHAIFDRLVYARLRAALGGRVDWAVSGGAPLAPRFGHFFRGVGLTILEGWGLTETTAPATVNCPDRLRIGTVGVPLPGVTVAVSDDGELLVKGINIMLGYHNNPGATAAALSDGWFRTGDLGEIDDDGFVRITGRKKEIIITAGGKNVAPTVLEDRLRSHPLISQCMVVGDQRPYIACLITLDEDMMPTWLSTHGRAALTVTEAAGDPAVRAEIQRAVDAANSAVSKAESIRAFAILDVDFTESGGYLTPKLSLKRQVILRDFAAQVQSLYP